MKIFACNFRNGITCKLHVTDEPPPQHGTYAHKIVWTGRPNRSHINPYVRWIHSVNSILAREWGIKLLHIFTDRNNNADSWLYEPGKKPKLVCHSTVAAVDEVLLKLNYPASVISHSKLIE